MSYDDRLKRLTKNEMTVLFFKCKGLKYQQIAERLGYSLGWVQLQMGGVYTKLGFSKDMHWTKRTGILDNEICPQLPKNIDDWQPVKVIGEGIREETKEEPASDPEMVALVLYDDMEIEKVKNKSLLPPKEKAAIVINEQEENKWIKILRRVLFGIVSMLIISAIAYFAYTTGRGATPAPEVVIITATFPPVTNTPLPTATSSISTNTSIPTTTPSQVPTNTAIPTDFVPPADGILFQDNFANGLSSEWTAYGGQWLVSNGTLTLLADDIDSYKWIALRKPEWKNYILSLTINIPHQFSAAQSRVAVAVRNEGSQSRYLGVPVDLIRNRVYWAFLEGYEATAIAGKNEGFEFQSGSTMEIKVENDTYTLNINGREIQKISMPGYDSGGISLGIYCYSELGCPSFDNVKVNYLP